MFARFVILAAMATLCAAQQPVAGASAQPATATPSAPTAAAPEELRSTYLLGPDDQITIHALDAEELNDKPVRINTDGHVSLPFVGRVMASGLTVGQLEAEITASLKKYIKNPEVSVSVVEFRSQPVSIIGSVKTPGIQQLQGRKTLIEMLSMAGGLADDAGHSVTITRRLEWGRIPLLSATDDPTGQFSVASINLDQIMSSKSPAENITICPRDIISVPRAEMVYVIGTVVRSGGYVLRERQTLSVLQALSLAGGIDHFAAPQKARILRPVAGTTSRAEIPINLQLVLAGKSGDVPLQAEDILFVPSSTPKRAITRAAEAALQIGTGLAIYRY